MAGYRRALILCALCLTSMAAPCSEYIATDRFTLIKPGPSNQEMDPLSVMVQLNFPPSVVTVEDAIVFSLKRSGWEFVTYGEGSNGLSHTLGRPLPRIHRSLSSMSLREALQVLIGQSYLPVEDPVRRLYSFDLKPQFRGLVNDE